MLPELWSAMHNSMPDGGRCRHFGVGENSSDADDRFLLAGNGYCVGEQRGFVRILCIEFSVFSPIDSASPESSISVGNDPTRYNPNLSEEEPLFRASTFNSGRASVML
jgi:hypothetical protein